jgi:hypothetical protein
MDLLLLPIVSSVIPAPCGKASAQGRECIPGLVRMQANASGGSDVCRRGRFFWSSFARSDAGNLCDNLFLGFTKAIEVPHGNKIGFVALQKGNTELMYQTYASVAEDLPSFAEIQKGPTFLYIEVDNLDAVVSALKNSKIVQPERTAFYGMREVGFQEPGGHYVTFAQPVAAAQQ